jgi:hypothetical protein
VLKMKITKNDTVVQHLPASAVRASAVSTWDGFVTNGLVAAQAGATYADTRSAKTRAAGGTTVVPTSDKRTAPFLIRDSSPPA